jgi:hypothetical protein
MRLLSFYNNGLRETRSKRRFTKQLTKRKSELTIKYGIKTIRKKRRHTSGNKTKRTKTTSTSTNVEEQRKLRIPHSSPVKTARSPLPTSGNWKGTRIQKLRASRSEMLRGIGGS